ncbi:MAG: hypothetical protein AAF802_16265, partial [Planctomycetota bacterium]
MRRRVDDTAGDNLVSAQRFAMRRSRRWQFGATERAGLASEAHLPPDKSDGDERDTASPSPNSVLLPI